MSRSPAPIASTRHARARLTTRGQMFLGAGIGLVVAGVVLGYGDITRVGVLLLVLPVFAVLLSSHRVARLQVARTVTPAVLRPDEPAVVQAVFRNSGQRSSRFGTAQDRIDASLGDRPRYTVASIPAGGTATVTYPVRGRARGMHHLGPAVIEHPDPFGMCTATTVVAAQDEVLVLPHTFALPPERLPRATGGDGDSGHSIALHGEQDVSIRTYVDGDELRRIHWPATAHRGQLMVRHEDRPERRHALLLYDARGGAHRLDGAYSSFEWAISATASIGLHLNAMKYQTHVLSPETLAAGQFENPASDEAILRGLARAQECTDMTHAEVLAQAARAASAGTIVVAILTDLADPALQELAVACGRGAVGIAVVIDTAAYRYASAIRTQGGAGSGSAAQDVARTFAHSGWRTAVAGPDTGIPAAWRAAAGSRQLGAMS